MKRGLRSKALVQKKRKILLQKFAALSFIFVFIITSYSVLSHVDSINISNINIYGNDIVTSEELTTVVQSEIDGRYIHLFSKSNILLFSEKNITASIFDSFKRIKSLKVGRTNMDTIYVTVEERLPHALWCSDKCYFIDSLGYIFTEAPEFSGNVFFKYNILINTEPIGTQLLTERDFGEIELLLNLLEDLGMEPVELSLVENIDFEVLMKDESKLIFSRDQDFVEVYDNLDSILSEIDGLLEYIDLRFGSKIYYRYVE